MSKLETKMVCEGIQIDKNVIPSYLNKMVSTGQANFSIERVYYSGQGERCQSGNCNHRIHNVFVLKDNDTGEEFLVGSECVKKYGNGIDTLVTYWKNRLEKAKRAAMWKAKKRTWADEKEEKKRQSIEAHRAELEFIAQYLELKPSNFLESIQNVIENGWNMSEKQRAVLDRIMTETNFAQLEEEAKRNEERFEEVLELIEVLDHVRWGFHPGQSTFRSIREQFAERGSLTDKQVEKLKKWVHRFRRQKQDQ